MVFLLLSSLNIKVKITNQSRWPPPGGGIDIERKKKRSHVVYVTARGICMHERGRDRGKGHWLIGDREKEAGREKLATLSLALWLRSRRQRRKEIVELSGGKKRKGSVANCVAVCCNRFTAPVIDRRLCVCVCCKCALAHCIKETSVPLAGIKESAN